MFKRSITKQYLALVLSLTMLLGAIAPGIAMAEVVQGTEITAPSTPQTDGTTPDPAQEAEDPASPQEGAEEPVIDSETPVEEEPAVEEEALEETLAETLLAPDATGFVAYEHLAHFTNVIGTRVAGSAEEVAAGNYLMDQFTGLGMTPSKIPFSYVRSGNTVNSNNIIAVLPGASTREIIVGAHYDSVRTGTTTVQEVAYTGKGSDDNASGVAVMLETAKALSELSAAERPYTIRFIAFGAEEQGLQGSNAYVRDMSDEEKANTVAMINLDSLAAGDFMYIYGSGGNAGFIRDLGLEIVKNDQLEVITNEGKNPAYPKGTTGDWSDHAPFKRAGIPYAYLEATNWDIGDLDGYTQTVQEGRVFHTYKDNIAYISQAFPGRIEKHLSTFTHLLTKILIQVQEPQALELYNENNHEFASMTERRTFEATFELPQGVDVNNLSWTYDGKPLSEWKTYVSGQGVTAGYNGAPFIRVDSIVENEGEVTATITFDLPYGTVNLSGTPRRLYPQLIGTFELAAVANGQAVAYAPVKLTPYDSYRSYAELKPEIDEITAKAEAAEGNNRYIETTSIGKSVEGRDIYFTILAKDKETVDKYQTVTHPAMLNDPKKLQDDIESGAFGDYKVPIWLNNIHPDEAPGVDVILNYFETMALEDSINYDTTLPGGQATTVTLNMDEALEDVFFLFVYTQNPDGRVNNTRANAEGFDLNRDNSYQTQPETRIVTEQIAKWSPLSFLDMHGFVGSFLIEPCTPPHDPNFEFDLLIDNMVAQAKAMGEAGIANTKYTSYDIPYEEHRKSAADPNYVTRGTTSGWDDASPAYTAVFAMHHGAMGHTLEMPELNEESTRALYYTAAAATSFVMEKKEELFLNQLKVYERGVNNEDNRAVDQYFINAKNEVIGRPRVGDENFFPEYYVLPVDRTVQKNALESYRMVEYLLRNGIKVERSNTAVTVDGVTYPAGSYVVNMHQAKRGLANVVLYDGINVSDFRNMYADIIQNFHDLRGFDRYVIREEGSFTGKTDPITSVTIPVQDVPNQSVYVLIRNSNNDATKLVNDFLKAGKTVTMLKQSGPRYNAGDFVVAYNDLSPVAHNYYLEMSAFSNIRPNGKLLKSSTIAASGVPAYVLKSLGFEVTTDQVAADVLVNTSGSTALINDGKPYIGFGRASMNTIRTAGVIPGFDFETTGNSHEGVFLTNVTQDNVITNVYDEQEYFYTVSGSYITAVPVSAKVLATTSEGDDFFKAGWWPNHDRAKGKVLAFTYTENNKDLTIFSNELVNRAHTQHQYRLLTNAIFNAGPGENYVAPAPDPGTTPGPGTDPTDPTNPTDPTDPTDPTEPGTPVDPEEPGVPTPEFGDLGGVEAWAGEAIRELAGLGIINGVAENQFAPLKQVTRAEFLTMIVRAFNLVDENASVSFSDVQTSNWHYTYVASAVEAGLVQGVGGNRFEPNRAITREEMAIMAANVLKLTQDASIDDVDGALAKFTDRGTIASYAREAIALLTEEGVIQGMTATTYGPKGIANRAQAAVIISRMLHLND